MLKFYYKCFYFLFCLFLYSSSFAQNIIHDFGDEWIQYNKPYFKIKIAQTGFYKVTYESLKRNNLPIEFFEADNLQLWHRGKQQPISIKGGKILQSGDYFIFYGIKNNGAQDSSLYYPATPLYNKYTSLYSDTSAYFLTIGHEINKRTTTLNTKDYANPTSAVTSVNIKSYFDTYWSGGYIDPLVTHFQPGEGWSRNSGYQEKITEDIWADGYTPGQPAFLEILVSDQENRGFSPKLSLISPNGNPLLLGTLSDPINQPYGGERRTFELPNDLTQYLWNSTTLRVEIDHTGQGIISTFFTKITYLKNTHFLHQEKGSFWTSTATKLSLQNRNTLFGIIEDNGLKYWIAESISNNSLLLPSLPSLSQVYYSNSIDSITSLERVTFKKYIPTDSTYLIITAQQLLSSAHTYAAYRHSAEGGGFDTMVVDVKDVFDQFSYGEKTPLAIRRFLNRLKSQKINSPDHLFLIGFSLQLDHQSKRQNPSLTINPAYEDLVLTAGVPGGDNVFSIGLDGTPASNSYNFIKSHYSTVSTGRLSAKINTTVINYLEKVKEHDATSYKESWPKNVLHLSGGFDNELSFEENRQEAKRMLAIMKGFENIISQPHFGANVSTIGRSTATNTEVIDISNQVNKGVSLITFFGHSGVSYSDISIGMVSNDQNYFGYNNKGKYPVLFLNGCLAGNTYLPDAALDVPSTPDQSSHILNWVLTKDRGAIAAYSYSGYVYNTYLSKNIENTYISSFLDSNNITKSFGEQIKLAQKRYYEVYSTVNNPETYTAAMIENATIEGDPAIHLIPYKKPDYQVDCENISLFSAKGKIETTTDSFFLQIPVKNIGLISGKNVSVAVKRNYLSNTQSKLYPPQNFLIVKDYDTLRIKIKDTIPEAVGLNTFEIVVDPENQVQEMDKSNNRCSFITFLSGLKTLCISPKKFSIVNNQPINLVAQPSIITSQNRQFYFELDTSSTFNSTFKKTYTTSATDLPRWPNVSLLPVAEANDSIVYYWRVKCLQPEQNEDSSYSYSSFIFINKSSSGWSQSTYSQFQENDLRGIILDTVSKKWKFQRKTGRLQVTALGKSITDLKAGSLMTFQNIHLAFKQLCYYPGFYMLTLNPVDFRARWVTPDQDNYLYACDYSHSPYISRFPNDYYSPGMLKDVLENNVQHGEIVVFTTINGGKFPFPDSLNTVLKSYYGASSLDSLIDGSPYILVARKGFGKIAEKLPTSSDPLNDTLTIDTTLTTIGQEGYITSSLIGPVQEWGQFFCSYSKRPEDILKFNIHAIDSSGKTSLVIKDVPPGFNVKNSVDAKKYSYIKLEAFAKSLSEDVPQLNKWYVTYKGTPEGSIIIDPFISSQYLPFTLAEGDTTKRLNFYFKNISSESFQPKLVVQYKITNGNRMVSYYDTLRNSLLPDSIWKSTLRIKTLGFSGTNKLEVFFNPAPGQKENLLDNNQMFLTFQVESDNIHPLLDVNFDGVKIVNGEIVPPSPNINITLHDDNQFLPLTDTSSVTIELARPCALLTCPFEKINLRSKDIHTIVSSNGGKVEIIYKPQKLPDGMYTLRVQAKDATGNSAGVKPYIINFEVVNEVAISSFVPYPNPFSSKMLFAFTITGEVPDDLSIKIYTVTGKRVKNIVLQDIGPLKIGYHNTDYAWDGTDDYGNLLPNGLYLFKLEAKRNGKEIKKRGSENDNLFNNEYGKIYILR